MNIKNLVLGFVLGIAFLSGCNDELSQVGPSIQPNSDRSYVYADTFYLEASTVQLDSIYARTASGLLGQLYDPLYGNLKADYICEFYCPEDYQFAYEPLDGKVDSMAFFILYESGEDGYVGDSLAPMTAQVYQVTKSLERNFYTNLDPTEYCDMQTLLGQKTYTAYDLSISDSIRSITDTSDEYYYTPNVRIRISTDVAQRFYDETVNNPSTFQDQDSFNAFFPGFYVTTSYGTGNILKVAQSTFYIYYRYQTETSAGNDTIISTYEQFNVTKEVIQMNQIKNGNIDQLLVPNEQYTYLKSPAGVCTKLVLPAADIKEAIGDRILNNLDFSLQAMPQEEWLYALEAPTYLILMPEDSVKNFFEESRVNDSNTSFLCTYDTDTRIYSFGNISNVVREHLSLNPEEDLRLLIFPVSVSYDSSSGSTTAISHYMMPAAVKLKKDEDYRQFVVVTSQYDLEE